MLAPNKEGVLMNQVMQRIGALSVLLISAWFAASADVTPDGGQMKPHTSAVPGILPSGLGEAVDRDVERARAATAPFHSADRAVAAGYKSTTECVEHQPHGGMGLHFDNPALRDATLDVEKPEVLVYEQRPDGSFKLNGVEFIVPISAWKRDEPPTIMGQKLKRAEKLGFWYLHVWIWEPSPSGLFADWNPRVKCPKSQAGM
jgi:hypothetical protein